MRHQKELDLVFLWSAPRTCSSPPLATANRPKMYDATPRSEPSQESIRGALPSPAAACNSNQQEEEATRNTMMTIQTDRRVYSHREVFDAQRHRLDRAQVYAELTQHITAHHITSGGRGGADTYRTCSRACTLMTIPSANRSNVFPSTSRRTNE
jgi:hypothetical protein